VKKKIRFYAALGFVAFLIGTTVSDVFASMTVGGERFGPAVGEHFYWAGMELFGTLSLLLPFAILAVIGSWVEARSTRLKGLIVFALPTLYLIYSYFVGYRAAKLAELDHRWTAATLSIGFLPFAAVPVVLIAWLVAFILVRLKGKKAQPASPE
jgi:hypothetical protein